MTENHCFVHHVEPIRAPPEHHQSTKVLAYRLVTSIPESTHTHLIYNPHSLNSHISHPCFSPYLPNFQFSGELSPCSPSHPSLSCLLLIPGKSPPTASGPC